MLFLFPINNKVPNVFNQKWKKRIQLSELNEDRKNVGATIHFYGVQVFQILIRIVRFKFVDMLIGLIGLGNFIPSSFDN